MNPGTRFSWAPLVAAAVALTAAPALAQDFDSGSDGSLGDLTITNAAPQPRVIPLPPNGVLNYRTFTVNAGATVVFQRNAANTPVYLLATGDVTINGIINVVGGVGGAFVSIGLGQIGGLAAPGGFDGGSCKTAGGSKAGAGLGPGGGLGHDAQAGGGGASPIADGAAGMNGAAGGRASSAWNHLVLHGGSGGGCGGGFGGGGGGGALTIASSTLITLNSTINAQGGLGVRNPQNLYMGGQGGSGMVRLIADRITGNSSGRIDVAQSGCLPGNANNQFRGGCGGAGLVRIEGFDVAGDFLNNVVPLSSLYFGTPRPALPPANRTPTLRVTQVSGPRGGDQPIGDVNQADVPIKKPVAYLDDEADITVTVAAANVPLGTRVIVRAKPLGAGTAIEVQSTPLAGELGASTATATFQLPAGTEIGTIEAHIAEVALP